MSSHPEGFLEIREAHYQKYFGPLTEKVMHSTDMKPVHVDIYQFPPTARRPFWTLITSGMSNDLQPLPQEAAKFVSPRTELMMCVREPKPWMFSVLKGLAEMPFEDNTHLHWWHTVQNGQSMTAEPSLLTAFFFLPPYFEETGFDTLQLGGQKVDILWLVPITEAERKFATEHGSQALEDLMSQKELDRVVDESRRSIV